MLLFPVHPLYHLQRIPEGQIPLNSLRIISQGTDCFPLGATVEAYVLLDHEGEVIPALLICTSPASEIVLLDIASLPVYHNVSGHGRPAAWAAWSGPWRRC